jgi:glycosyltransferase involved in cell wall biosynthesis
VISPAQKLPISVCVISGAEARRISKTLESVADWVSEIVIVLNEEVSDGTDSIAAKFGATVFRESWKGFIGQKNSVLQKATQPWILALDADEIVSAKMRGEIHRLFNNPNGPAADAVNFPRCTLYCGRWIRHGDWYPDRCVRLWKRGVARWAGVDPHARLAVEGHIVEARGDIEHLSMESLTHQVMKTISYADDFVRLRQRENRPITALDLVVRPAWRFFRGYVLKLGFLDGWQGYSIAWMTAFYTFLRYAKAREAELSGEPPK